MHATVIDAETINASSSYTSKPVAVPGEHGNFSLYWHVAGDGTCKFEWEESVDGATYIENDGQDIVTGQTKTSGPGSNGKDMVDFAPQPCAAIKIKCTETGTSNSVTVTAILHTT